MHTPSPGIIRPGPGQTSVYVMTFQPGQKGVITRRVFHGPRVGWPSDERGGELASNEARDFFLKAGAS
eukprot:1922424-Pyramimonas_sp.AAC.1